MKNTDDLMGFLEPNQFDNIPIENTQLSEDKINRIYSLTMENINCKAKPIKKRMSKKVIISLIAAIIVVSSLTVFAAGQMLFPVKQLPYGRRVQTVDEVFPNRSNTPLQIVKGDQYTMELKAIKAINATRALVLVDIIANDGHSLCGSYITYPLNKDLDDKIKVRNMAHLASVDVNGDILDTSSPLAGCIQLDDGNPNDNRISFQFQLNTLKLPSLNHVIVNFENMYLLQQTETEDLNSLNLKNLVKQTGKVELNDCTYFKERDEYAIKGEGSFYPIDFPPKTFDQLNKEERIKYDRTPYYFLPDKTRLNKSFTSKYTNYKIQTAAMIDGKLQMVLSIPFDTKTGTATKVPKLVLQNKKTGEVKEAYWDYRTLNEFYWKAQSQGQDIGEFENLDLVRYRYVFDVKENDLKNWELKGKPEYKVQEINVGDLKCVFPINKSNFDAIPTVNEINKTATVKQIVSETLLEYMNDSENTSKKEITQKILVEKIAYSSYGIQFMLQEVNPQSVHYYSFADIYINMKDNTKIKVNSEDYANDVKRIITFDFDKKIKLNDIRSIVIGDLEIPLN
ncbi:hypothetical protein RBG61_03865 [Paludicola sp. MB14-C6]|uniref:hypothetical protein n=1 Tax=Paludihabitans sp. MB14-C6 TaxID=3070656 RepID=UPI0027DBA767|nr:hypothetical protein [Paludicola sp. MB14-C6]WMJ23812.1 hypothetical protein RBG61_03865 [Paludicola sp. MB14-C6]